MGGNYNLRYLPAHYRRDLRPQIRAYDEGIHVVADRQFPHMLWFQMPQSVSLFHEPVSSGRMI